MRKSIGITTFIVISAGAAGAGALDNFSMKGSDTLRDVTRDLLLNCPGADPDPANAAVGIVYEGTGSGNGEDAMRAGTQTIAPMSRFLAPYGNASATGKTCNVGTLGSPAGQFGTAASSEGLVIGLDGVSIVASKTTGASDACNGPTATNCATNGLGLGDEGNPALTAANGLTDTARYGAGLTYQFNTWRDVLRVVFAGMEHSDGSDLTKRNCSGQVRKALAASYGLLFKTNCTTGGCTELHHAFIRDNESGTSDAMVALLGLPSINLPNNVSPWCNALRSTDALPFDPTKSPRLSPDYQDYDTIRRDCATNEEVCSHIANNSSGTAQRYGLGLVLTIASSDFIPETQPITDAFPTAACTSFELTTPSVSPIAVVTPKRCPNGDSVAFGGQCFWPKSAAGSYKCLNAFNKRPSVTIDVDSTGTPNSWEGRPISTADGRVYNTFLLKDPTTAGTPPTLELDGRNRPMQGAYYRIHTTKSITAPTVTCQNRQSTTQIGCLVAASNCSIGYAGREAASATTNTASLRVHQISPVLDECITTLTYPINRKLYVSSYLGFQAGTVATQEFELAKCFSSRAKIDTILTNRHFVPLPNTVPAGFSNSGAAIQPFCEDFNETQCVNLGSPANVDACGDNNTAATTIPSTVNESRCGDGARQYGEQCDDGNNVNGDGCNSSCGLEN